MEKSVTKSIISYNDSELEEIKAPKSKSNETITNNNTVNNNSLSHTQSLSISDLSQIPSNTFPPPIGSPPQEQSQSVIFIVNYQEGNQEKTDICNNYNKLYYNLDFCLENCPLLYQHLEKIKISENNNVVVNLPNWISKENLIEYFNYVQNSAKKVFSYNFFSLLKISSFFNNNQLTKNIITQDIIPSISFNNAMPFLEISFDFLTTNEPNQSWIELFVTCLDYISNSLTLYLIHDSKKIYNLNSKLQNEIINKYISSHLNFFIVDSNVIDFILTNKKCNYLSDAIINEYFSSMSTENINEIISTSSTPSLSLDIDIDGEDNIYMEVPIQKMINNVNIIAVITYKKYDNFFNVNLKIPQSQNEIHNFFTHNNLVSFVVIAYCDENDNKQINIKSFSKGKNCINIYRQYLGNSKYYSSVKFNLFLKINYVHTALVNHFVYHYEKYYNEKNIYKIGQNLLTQILICAKEKNLFINKNIDNMLYCSISNWLIDEVNIHIEENVKDLLGSVNWNNVDIDNLFTFYLKFYDLIHKNGLTTMLLRILDEKSKDKKISEIIDKVSREIEYVQLIDEIYKSKKDNMNFERGIGLAFKCDEISTINKSKIDKFMNDEELNKNTQDNNNINNNTNLKSYEITKQNNFDIYSSNKPNSIDSDKNSTQRSSLPNNKVRIFSYNDFQIQSLVSSSEIKPQSSNLNTITTINQISTSPNNNDTNNPFHYHKRAPSTTYTKYKNTFKISNKLHYKNQKSIFSSRIINNSRLSKHSFSNNKNSTALTNENSRYTRNKNAIQEKASLGINTEFSKTMNSNSKLSFERVKSPASNELKKSGINKSKVSTNGNNNSSMKSLLSTHRSSSNIKVVINTTLGNTNTGPNNYSKEIGYYTNNINKKPKVKNKINYTNNKNKKNVKALIFK